MRIVVTAKDIEGGLPRHSFYCPIALAAKRVFRGARVQVGERHLSVIGKLKVQRKSLPTRARTFVRNFDNGRAVKPFSFTL